MANLKVFVSSTYVDLRDLRKQLEVFIKESGHNPVLFEKGGIYFDWTVPFDVSCYAEVPRCDMYVLIIGGRYGSPATAEAKSKRFGIKTFNSVTKNEYAAAKAADMPIFIFVDTKVLTTYATYCQNGKRLDIKYAYVDNNLIFRLLDDVYSQERNNFCLAYTSVEEITSYLRSQWAGMLHDYISKKQLLKSVLEKDVYLNGYKLFYYRYSKGLTPGALANLSGVNRDDIRKLETVRRRKGSSAPRFAMCSPAVVKALEEALACPSELSTKGDGDFASQFMEYYRLYKGRSVSETETKPELPFVTKAIFFDFDGTLTNTSDNLTHGEPIWRLLGYSINECSMYHDQYTRKLITHKQWCDITLDYFVKAGMREQHLSEVADSIVLISDAIETLEHLHKRGVKLYIISGSIYYIIKRVLGSHSRLFDEIRSNNMLFDSENGQSKLTSIVGTEYDFEGKANFIREQIRNNAFSPLEVLFVGNSVNDIYASRSGARTLCVNPHFTSGGDVKHWTHCIKDMKSLKMILDYIKVAEDRL